MKQPQADHRSAPTTPMAAREGAAPPSTAAANATARRPIAPVPRLCSAAIMSIPSSCKPRTSASPSSSSSESTTELAYSPRPDGARGEEIKRAFVLDQLTR